MQQLPHLEGLAISLYERLGYDPAEAESPLTLARRWLGADAVIGAPATQRAPAVTFRVHGQLRIAVRRSLTPSALQFWIGHELGHALLDEDHLVEQGERAADTLGACLVAPRPYVTVYGDDWRALAEDVGSTQTLAALRTAEVLSLPRAVITPARVYLRGPEGFVWPLARRKIDRMPGVRKTQLDDDPRRFVLDVNEGG